MPQSPLHVQQKGRFQILSRSPTAAEDAVLLGIDQRSHRPQATQAGRFHIENRPTLSKSKKYVMDRSKKMAELKKIGEKLSRLEGEYHRTRQEYDALYASIVGARDDGPAQKGRNVTFRRSEASGVSKKKQRRSRRRRR